MEFQIEEDGFVKIRKVGHVITRPQKIYKNKDCSTIGIANLDNFIPRNSWCVVHTLTKRILVKGFSSKADAEDYLDVLSKEMDLNSAFLFSTEESIMKNFKKEFEGAYIKHLKDKEKSNEESGDI